MNWIHQSKDTQWLDGLKKKTKNPTLLMKYKSKPQWGIISHWSEWPSSKSLQTINAGEGEEKGNPCTLLVGMQTDTTTMENSMEILKKLGIKLQ